MSLAVIVAAGRGSVQYGYEPTDWSMTLCIVPGVEKENEGQNEGRNEGWRKGIEGRTEIYDTKVIS